MEASEQQKQQNGAVKKRHQATIVAPVAPEREIPAEVTPEVEKMEKETPAVEKVESMEKHESEIEEESRPRTPPGADADAELTIMLKQIEAYFTRHAGKHDLEAISFSLRHLFSRVDFLYRQALPDLEEWTARARAAQNHEPALYQQIWLHLQTINRTLDRMAPLCHLLSDVIECLLDTLDDEENWLRTFEEEETLLLERVAAIQQKAETPSASRLARALPAAPAGDSDVWERAVTTLMDRLLTWQEQHHQLASFLQQFAQPTLATDNLNELDAAFALLLDSAGAIFGDILPNFRLVGPADKEEISALLFDLMQQSDQMLVQFEVTLEPLTGLMRHFAAMSENG